jgi:hypothetical protein
VCAGMGGPVAVCVAELCAEEGVQVELLCYCEGNLDAGDCYHAFALARNVIHKELYVACLMLCVNILCYIFIRECVRLSNN